MSAATDVHRTTLLNAWLGNQGFDLQSLIALTGDASFRRYFRIQRDNRSYVVMDAPPAHEKPQAFYDLAKTLANHSIHTPQIHDVNLDEGWLVIDDFGDQLLSHVIDTPDALPRYQQAIHLAATLLQIPVDKTLPAFDAAMQLTELKLFCDWFIETHLGYTISHAEYALLTQSYEQIIQRLLRQPQVFVHRDFHCRNLMILPKTLGVIDFQDAVTGPYTYDLVSLLKDAYTSYAYQQSDIFTTLFWDAMPTELRNRLTYQQYLDDIRWTGIQRHLKVIGIFARLYRRDGKSTYLNDIPLVFRYLMDALEKTPELSQLYNWLEKKILPHYQQQLNLIHA